MKLYQRILAALAACLLLCQGGALAAGGGSTEEDWRRVEPGGDYVTIRVDASVGETLSYGGQMDLAVRYADTGEPVALSSGYLDGYLFATVPARDADRPLEVFQGEEPVWTDLEQQYLSALGAENLQIRGIIQGDEAGRLNQDASITRAQAFALIVRLLCLEPAGDPRYSDVSPENWYYDAASAARAAGIASADEQFYPQRPVTRAEFTVMLARAMEAVGWLEIPETADSAQLTTLADAETIPDWALSAYLAFQGHNRSISILTELPTGEYLWEDAPVLADYAQPDLPATRGEVITMTNQALRWLPWYPTELAIQLGFDEEMPVIDGSTSTYNYTVQLYWDLFTNHDAHPQFPKANSKSYESYERLIRGEADVLFAATRASQDLEALARREGVELEYIPIAQDAMVFFTNEENAITGLTQEQIQDIYVRNAYDNWNEVGGPDAKLLAYCRNTDSGSHALMERYFLEGGELSLSPEILQVRVSKAMSSALSDVGEALSLDPPAYAIGYSVYAYYENYRELMVDVTPNQVKLLAIDGVLPTDETIADGSYPLADYNYVVIRADEPENSPARRLADFMLTAAGQEVVSSAGFLPLPK